MKTLLALCATALLCFATGCASRPEAFEPMAELTPESDFEVTYSGGIGAKPIVNDLPVPEGVEDPDTKAYELEVRFLRAKPENARRMFGDRAIEIGASSLPAAEVTEELLAQATLISAPRLLVYEKQKGTVLVANQLSFVSGFELQGKEATRVADPIVEVANEGIYLEMHTVSADENKLRLTVGVTMSEIVRPIEVQKVRLYGADVEIQVPVTYTQQLSAAGDISEDRVLVLTGMMGRDNDIYTVLISGRRASLDDVSPDEPPSASPEDKPEDK